MTLARHSVVSVVMFNHFYMTLQMQKYVLNVINIDGQHIVLCLHFKRAKGM